MNGQIVRLLLGLVEYVCDFGDSIVTILTTLLVTSAIEGARTSMAFYCTPDGACQWSRKLSILLYVVNNSFRKRTR